MRVADKVAVISGGAHGMGEAEARLFAKEGAKVVLTDLLEKEGEAVAASIREAGGEALFLRADVTSDDDWAMVFDRTLSTFGKLDILVNNAGISSSAVGPDLLSIDGWHKLMEVNATSVFLGTRRAVEIMKEAGKGGAIVNISSMMAIIGGVTGHPGYHASKAAVRNFTKAMAVRYGEFGIRVNSVHPGTIEAMVGATNAWILPERAKITPLRCTGKTKDIAYGVLYLASDEAAFVTGAELVIDGGFTVQ